MFNLRRMAYEFGPVGVVVGLVLNATIAVAVVLFIAAGFAQVLK